MAGRSILVIIVDVKGLGLDRTSSSIFQTLNIDEEQRAHKKLELGKLRNEKIWSKSRSSSKAQFLLTRSSDKKGTPSRSTL